MLTLLHRLHTWHRRNVSYFVRTMPASKKSTPVLRRKTRPSKTLYQSQEDKFSYLVGKKRKEATQQEKRQFSKQFLEAKQAECKSWFDNDVFELVDMRKLKIRNYVAGRWVLTIKKDKDGNFLKCKARWVLKGFQDRQKDTQQTDSPAASRSGLRCATQFAANCQWDLYHMDLKTAFLQGEAYDETRDIICQIPVRMRISTTHRS